jgi:hypothetical protein
VDAARQTKSALRIDILARVRDIARAAAARLRNIDESSAFVAEA